MSKLTIGTILMLVIAYIVGARFPGAARKIGLA